MIQAHERSKYTDIWSKFDYTSKNNEKFFNTLINFVGGMNPDIRLLEIGFGKGLILDKLARKGFECYGVDITLEGLKHNPNIHDGITFREAYAWNLPFGNDQFDIVYSTDVLEHIPPLYVGETIKELKRVSKNLNVHCIATVPDSKRFGYDCHLSVLPIEVWQKHFWGVNNYIFEREF